MEDVVVDWTGDRIVLSGEVSSDELAQLAEQIVGDRFGLRVENRLRVLPTLRELPGALAQPESKVPDLEGQPLFRSTARVDERTDAGESGSRSRRPTSHRKRPGSDGTLVRAFLTTGGLHRV